MKKKDVYMVALRDGYGIIIGYYEKHEYRNIEAAKLYDSWFDFPSDCLFFIFCQFINP